MSSKGKLYQKLVEKRKNHDFPSGLINPSQVAAGKYDKDPLLSPWSRWQGNLDADILVVGKDWGDVNTYLRQKGRDLDQDQTNINLRILFKELGIEIGRPSNPNTSTSLFFTNAVLGLRTEGGKAGNLKASWIKEDTNNFLRPLLEIINPPLIITLGADAYLALSYIFRLKKDNLKNLITHNPHSIPRGSLIFAMYHCGQIVTRRIRDLELQKQDWKNIKEYL